MQFQFLKVETQSSQVCWKCTTFRYDQTHFRRVEEPCLGHHMIYPRLSHPSLRTISHSNLFIYKHLREKKNTWKVCKWIFQIAIGKNVSITCIFNHRNLVNSLIHSTLVSFFYIRMFFKKTGIQCCLKFLCDATLLIPIFIF